MKSDLKILLAQSEFFKSLNPQNRQAIGDICLMRSLKKREILFLEGEKGHAIYIMGFGSIQLFKTSPEGNEVVIKVVKPGELFAEAILFEKSRYPVSAVALEKSLVYMIPKTQFDCLLENREFRNDFITNLMQKLRYLTEQIQVLTHYNVETRFFRFLKIQYGTKKEVKLSLSKKDIAAAIGTTPETLSRLITRLTAENKIQWDGKRLKMKISDQIRKDRIN